MVKEIVTPGLFAGWAAGLAMLLVAMIGAAIVGAPVYRPLQLVSGFLFDTDALTLGSGAVFMGLVVHLALSGFFGVLFNTTLPRAVSFTWAVGAAFVYTLLVYLFMTWVVLPWLNPLLFRTVPPGVLLIYHLAYAAVLPLALPMRRNARARRMERPAGP